MERDDTDDGRRGRREVEHEHPAQPEQTGDEGFESGQDHKRDTPEEEREPNFARGSPRRRCPGTEHHGRFSEGQEDLPPTTPRRTSSGASARASEESPTST